MAINESGEILREQEKCNIRLLTRKERFEYLIKQVNEVKSEIFTANTEECVNNAINNLVNLMFHLSQEPQVSDIHNLIPDISGTIRGVKLHDITRSNLIDMLQKLTEKAEEIVSEEKKKENSEKFKTLCMQLAEHADEISQVIDLNQIFG